jgi:hypothetical protein
MEILRLSVGDSMRLVEHMMGCAVDRQTPEKLGEWRGMM